MAKQNHHLYHVNATFTDKEIADKSDNPITFATTRYDLDIDAESAKAAYDIAIEHIPYGSVIRCIELIDNYSTPHRGYRDPNY